MTEINIAFMFPDIDRNLDCLKCDIPISLKFSSLICPPCNTLYPQTVDFDSEKLPPKYTELCIH